MSVAAGAHALTFPWYPGPVTNGFNPAVMVGTDRDWKSGDGWRFFYAVSIGFFRHNWWMTGVSIEPEVGVGRGLPGGFQADVRLGLGYMHYFWRRKSFRLEDGRYVEVTDRGRPSVIVPLSATLAYRGNSRSPLPVSPFVSGRWGVQGMFLEEVPAMTHLLLMAGVRIDPERESPTGGR